MSACGFLTKAHARALAGQSHTCPRCGVRETHLLVCSICHMFNQTSSPLPRHNPAPVISLRSD